MFRPVARRLALAVVAAGALSALPATASASTTVYPAGHTLDLGTSTDVNPFPAVAGPLYCRSVHRGTVDVPAVPGNSNASGPVTLAFSTLPTFSGCQIGTSPMSRLPITITASGAWTLSLEWGVPATATVSVPAYGVTASVFCAPGNMAPTTGRGEWQNGFASPLIVNSVLEMQTMPVGRPANGCNNVQWATTSYFDVSDVTDPTQVALVGP